MTLEVGAVGQLLGFGRLRHQDHVGHELHQIVLLGVRRHRRKLAGFLLGHGEIALMDFDAVDLGDHRVLVLRGNRPAAASASASAAARTPVRRSRAGHPAGNRNVMMLSLETMARSLRVRGVLVTQQPWHCNGRAAPSA